MKKKIKSKKKMLIVADSFLPRIDGISIFVDEVSRRLRKYYDITLLGPSFNKKIVKEKYKHITVLRFPVFNFKISNYAPTKPRLRLIKKYVKASDIVFVQSITPLGFFSMLYAFRMKKKVSIYMHSIEYELVVKSLKFGRLFKPLLSFLIKNLSRYLYNKCDIILAPSKRVLSLLKEEGIYKRPFVVPVGVNHLRFNQKNKEKAKKKIKLSGKFVIGYCGRINPEKDLLTLIKAYKKLKVNFKDVVLLIVGDGDAEIKKHLIDNGAIVTGFKKNVEDYYNAMDVHVLPSSTETTSLVNLEAMACGVPVISTSVGNIKDYLVNKKNGFIFDGGDVDGLARLIKKLILDNKLRNRLSKNAVKTSFNYSWFKTAKTIKKIFDAN